MRVSTSHTLGDLERDLSRGPTILYREGRKIVREAGRVGLSLAKDNARRKSGPHGKDYYKRLTVDPVRSASAFGGGSISVEYGPAGIPKSEFVGAGYRNGPGNTDLAKSADVVGPALAGESRKIFDAIFWPGSET